MFLTVSDSLKNRRLVFVLFLSVLISNLTMVAAFPNQPTKTTFTSVSSGDHFSCGLTDKGDVYCWGANERSQLGTSDRIRNLIPNKVYEVSNAVEIAAGSDFACARISDGGVACWGRGDLGQTGDGFDDTKDRIFATRVPTISSAVGISAGQSHACALVQDKSVLCWGSNDFWQLGNISSTVEKLPLKVQGIPNVKQIASGSNHTCALAESGFAYCWGDNRFGQLGNGNKNLFKTIPTLVLGISDVSTLQLGANTSCGITSTPEVKCWGWGRDGQLAGVEIANQYFPTETSLKNLTAISPGRTKACGIFNATNSSLLYCWGTLLGTYPTTGPASLSVSLGYDHGCVVTSLGFIQCFGWNHKGQLGTGVVSLGVSSISTVSSLSFPDWLYYVNSWTISYENDLAILKWVGGQPRYKVRIESLGIVCEDLATANCKFGPLKSNTLYKGEITALNTGGVSPLIGVAPIEFTTGTLVAALDQYQINQQTAAKAALEKEAAAAKLEKEKADLEKANKFLATLSTQIDKTAKIEALAVTNFVKNVVETDKYIETLQTSDLNIANSQNEIRKLMSNLRKSVAEILKKIGR
jgi:alpha-tubulin suppressor-like RCC1 family protein